MKPLFPLLTLLLVTSTTAGAQHPRTGYAPVNGLRMYYELHGPRGGDPIVLLHGSYMTIPQNWSAWIPELAKTRRVIAVEMQGHGRTRDIARDFSYATLADDIAALLDYLEIDRADLLGFSMGGGVAMQAAIRHPGKVRKVVSISAVFRYDGWIKEAVEGWNDFSAADLEGTPFESEYLRLSPTPEEFPKFVKHVIAMDIEHYDFGADKLKATTAPIFFIHGDADGVRLDHIAEMFRLKGEEKHGDLGPRSASRLAVLPNTSHLGLVERSRTIIPMVNDYLDAKPAVSP